MPKFMVMLHHSPGAAEEVSPEATQAGVQRYRDWLENIRASGRYVVSDKLQEEGGKLVSLRQGRPIVLDGPYSEAKEVIGGYVTIRAADYEEALQIVRECPFLELGTIAVRQTDPMGCGGE
jgi:hypothetical protein